MSYSLIGVKSITRVLTPAHLAQGVIAAGTVDVAGDLTNFGISIMSMVGVVGGAYFANKGLSNRKERKDRNRSDNSNRDNDAFDSDALVRYLKEELRNERAKSKRLERELRG